MKEKNKQAWKVIKASMRKARTPIGPKKAVWERVTAFKVAARGKARPDSAEPNEPRRKVKRIARFKRLFQKKGKAQKWSGGTGAALLTTKQGDAGKLKSPLMKKTRTLRLRSEGSTGPVGKGSRRRISLLRRRKPGSKRAFGLRAPSGLGMARAGEEGRRPRRVWTFLKRLTQPVALETGAVPTATKTKKTKKKVKKAKKNGPARQGKAKLKDAKRDAEKPLGERLKFKKKAAAEKTKAAGNVGGGGRGDERRSQGPAKEKKQAAKAKQGKATREKPGGKRQQGPGGGRNRLVVFWAAGAMAILLVGAVGTMYVIRSGMSGVETASPPSGETGRAAGGGKGGDGASESEKGKAGETAGGEAGDAGEGEAGSGETATETESETLSEEAFTSYEYKDPFQPLAGPVTSAPAETTTETTVSSSNRLSLEDITVEEGVKYAAVKYGGVAYKVKEGDRVGESPYQVVSVGDNSVTLLYGDEQVSLQRGQEIIK